MKFNSIIFAILLLPTLAFSEPRQYRAVEDKPENFQFHADGAHYIEIWLKGELLGSFFVEDIQTLSNWQVEKVVATHRGEWLRLTLPSPGGWLANPVVTRIQSPKKLPSSNSDEFQQLKEQVEALEQRLNRLEESDR